MPRQRRIHAPSCGIHITARTQFGERWFVDDFAYEVVEIIREATSTFGNTLLAYVVMPNHFHLVLKQSASPLAWTMQRMMQRIAHRLLKRRTVDGRKLEGHVFGRRYWSSMCNTPGYLRRAIVYAHLNPWQAKLCADPAEYTWSSHKEFLSQRAGWHGAPGVREGLSLFAGESLDPARVVANYMYFVTYTMERRQSGAPGDWLLPEGPTRLLIPPARLGDSHWATMYSSISHACYDRAQLLPIYDKAVALLRSLDKNCDLDMIRNGGRSRLLSELRRNLVAALAGHDYRTSDIARCLRVCPSLVSHIKASIRASAIHQ